MTSLTRASITASATVAAALVFGAPVAKAGTCPGATVDAQGYVKQCTTNPSSLAPGAHAVFWGRGDNKVIYGTCGVKTVAGPKRPDSIGLPDGKWYSCPTGWLTGGPNGVK